MNRRAREGPLPPVHATRIYCEFEENGLVNARSHRWWRRLGGSLNRSSTSQQPRFYAKACLVEHMAPCTAVFLFSFFLLTSLLVVTGTDVFMQNPV